MKTFLTNSFLKDYPDFPGHMNALGKFVYLRTYSRYLFDKERRENWKETCVRAVDYNMSLVAEHLETTQGEYSHEELKQEAEEFFDSMFNLNQFLSGRTLWVGGADTGVADKYPISNFNCAFTNIRKWKDISELFYLLLVGTGIGFKITKKFANGLPALRDDINIEHLEYFPVAKNKRLENTSLNIVKDEKQGKEYAEISVGDSKEGWVEALEYYLRLLSEKEFSGITDIYFNYNSVRPAGERLKTFGGTASGYEPLKEMFQGFERVIHNEVDKYLEPLERVGENRVKLRPVHIVDMCNMVGFNVIVGGVRRTSEIALGDVDDLEFILAKYGINGIYGDEGFENHEKVRKSLKRQGHSIPGWFDELAVKHYTVSSEDEDDFVTTDIQEARDEAERRGIEDYYPFPTNNTRQLHHRRMSNNSVAFEEKPPRKDLNLIVTIMKDMGEPGFINIREIARRRLQRRKSYFTEKELQEEMQKVGINPCAEILLQSKGLCNLTTLNITRFVYTDTEGNYRLDLQGLKEAQRRSARAGVRMTLVKLELENWDEVQKEDRLIGTSVTGWQDAMQMLQLTEEEQKSIMRILHDVSRSSADEYAEELGIPAPLLTTTVKPEGTISQVAGGVSSGLHFSHSKYFIRRVRISANDPLAKSVQEMGWTVNPEVGTPGDTWKERMENARTLVIDFPVFSGAEKTKDDVYVKEQFDTYFNYQENYTEHNSSNTIHIRPDEWDYAEERIYNNWDNFVGVSFLDYDGGSYDLAPYERIEQKDYNDLKSGMKEFDMKVLEKYEEKGDTEVDDNMDSCEGGACPIR